MMKAKFKWYITNINKLKKNDTDNYFFTNIPATPFETDKNKLVFIDGYIIPRLSIFSEYKNYSQKEVIEQLYLKYGHDFINYIKGMFIIIFFIENKIYIYNDRHSIKKYFIYKNGKKFIISNDLKFISQNVYLTFHKENIALYCLFEHFIDGLTMFNEVTFSKPATKLTINKEDILTIDNYWLPEELLNKESKNYSFEEIANKWLSIIINYLQYFNIKEITMTLTGGNDSRMILAALLANGIKPNAFTFGNPNSYDGIVAKEIASKIGLNYNNYFVNEPSPDWFDNYSRKIIKLGNSLINIHRSHRLNAIEDEMLNNPNNEMIFGGFMGGDYTKGIIYDDYITSKLMRLWKYSKLNDYQIVKQILDQSFFNYNDLDITSLIEKLFKLPYLNRNYNNLEREFFYVFYVVGAAHDWQDINIFSSKVKYVVTPFMDIDFLEILFSSNYSMLTKNNPDDNFIKKLLKYPSLAVNLTHILAPELSSIIYAKKGTYTNKEFLGNKIYYIIKRINRYRQKKKYPENFPYGDWFKGFVINNLFNKNFYFSDIFNINKLKNKFYNSIHSTKEGYWHKFTNPINIGLNLEEYIS